MGIHIRIWETLTFRVRRVFHPQQTNSFDKPKGAPGEPTEEEKNRIEPNRTEEPKADRAEDSRKTTTKQPDVFSQTDGTEKPNWTELEKENSARSVRRSAQCAVRQTNRQADEQTNGKAEGERGGGRRERPGTVARPWRTRESLLRGSLSVLSRRRAESNKQLWMYLDTLSVMSFPPTDRM